MKVQVQKLHTFRGHRDCVYTLDRSPLKSVFFSGSGDGMIVLWDLTDPDKGHVVAKLSNSVYALHYHPATGHLIAGHNYDGIHLLDWKNKKEIGSLQLTKAAIFDIQSSGNALYIATGEGSLVKVDTGNLSVLFRDQSTDKSARAITISEGRGEVAVGYSDSYIRVFDRDNLRLKHTWKAHANSVFTVRYTPDGNFLISGSRDAHLKVWDADAGYLQTSEIVAHLYAINHLDFSPDGKHFVTCSLDKSIKVWDAEKLQLLKVIDRARHAGHGTSVNKLLWTTFENQLVSASDDRTVSVWNINFEQQVL